MRRLPLTSNRIRKSVVSARIPGPATVSGLLNNPNPTEKRWNPVREDAIKSVRNRVGLAISNPKNLQAEPKSEQGEYPASYRDRTKDGTEGFEPDHDRTFLDRLRFSRLGDIRKAKLQYTSRASRGGTRQRTHLAHEAAASLPTMQCR